jgi:hypothetical protein
MINGTAQKERNCYHVPAGDLWEQVWPLVEPWLAEAMRHTQQHMMTTADLADGCRTNEYALLLMRADDGMIAAAAVIGRGTRPHDGVPYVCMMACGGSKMDDWLPELVATMKDIGRRIGAPEVMLLGRPGWRRVLLPHGARECATIVSVSTSED